MPKYRVRLNTDPGFAWTTDVEVAPYKKLSNAEIEKQARAQAIKAFGKQASGWTLLDAKRQR